MHDTSQDKALYIPPSWQRDRGHTIVEVDDAANGCSKPSLGARDWEITGLVPLFYFLCQHTFLTNILIRLARLIVRVIARSSPFSEWNENPVLSISNISLPLSQTHCEIQSLRPIEPLNYALFPSEVARITEHHSHHCARSKWTWSSLATKHIHQPNGSVLYLLCWTRRVQNSSTFASPMTSARTITETTKPP